LTLQVDGRCGLFELKLDIKGVLDGFGISGGELVFEGEGPMRPCGERPRLLELLKFRDQLISQSDRAFRGKLGGTGLGGPARISASGFHGGGIIP